jgi:hypothetical protein
MNRKTDVSVVLLLFLLAFSWWAIFLSKPAPPPQTQAPSTSNQEAARGLLSTLGEACCEIVPNPELNDQDRIVVAFPEGVNVSGTTVFVYQPGAAKQLALSVGGGTFPLAIGIYDVEVRKRRLTVVKVETGHDTRV